MRAIGSPPRGWRPSIAHHRKRKVFAENTTPVAASLPVGNFDLRFETCSDSVLGANGPMSRTS